MPIIEGNMTGRPVITSNIEPLKEIGGDAVLYADPQDFRSIRRAFEKIICEEGLYDELVNKGLRNVRRFTLDNIVKEYKQVYESL